MKTLPIVVPCDVQALIDAMKKKQPLVDTSNYGIFEYKDKTQLRDLDPAMSLTDVMTAHADDPMFKLVFKKRTPSVGFQADNGSGAKDMGLLIQTLSELLEQFPNPPDTLPEVSDSESADEPPAVSPENWTSDGVVEFLDSIGMGAYRDNFKQFNGKSFSLLGEAHMEKLAGNAADGKLIYLRLQEAKRSGRSSAYSSSSQGAATTPLKGQRSLSGYSATGSLVSQVSSSEEVPTYRKPLPSPGPTAAASPERPSTPEPAKSPASAAPAEALKSSKFSRSMGEIPL
ncbi:SAM domain (Sterile alpha motif) domain containing protein, partial [Acanthamoeba castellanii str. Neff]